MTRERPYFGLRGEWLTFWVTVACAADMTLYGYDQGVFGGVIITEDFLDVLDIQGKADMQSTIAAIYDIGCFFGALSTIFICDRLGRKTSITLGTTVLSIGAILQITAYSVPQMLVGRIVAGLGNGINTVVGPIWQSETSRASARGKLIVFELAMNCFGFFISTWLTYGFSYLSSGASWRIPLAFQFIFVFMLYGTVPWLPESPRWLITKNRIEEAEVVLADLEGLDVDDAHVITTSKDIQWAVNYEIENTVPWKDLLRGRQGDTGGTSVIRRLVLGMGTQAMQQLTGINVTSYYLPLVLINSVGLSNRRARLLAACNSISYLAATLAAVPCIERWGRRKMMIFSSLGQCFCYLFITVCIRYSEDSSLDTALQARWAEGSIVFFFLYYVFFGSSWQATPWMYQTEINSLSMRTKGSALSTATNWILNFLVVEITPMGIDNLRWRFYIVWVVLNASFVPIIYLFYPETSGRTLEDVDRFFKDNQNVIICFDKEATMVPRPQRYIDLEQEEIHRNNVSTLQHDFKGREDDEIGVSAHGVTHSEHVDHPMGRDESV